MAVTNFRQARRQNRRKRPILAIFRFKGRDAVYAWCWTMQEMIDAFRAAKGAA